jgi:hypothetical protein
MKTPTFVALSLALLCVQQAGRAQELTQTLITPEGCSIKLPGDWKRIDRPTLEDYTKRYTKRLAKDMPNARLQMPTDGFEPKTVQDGIGYPNIIVVPNKLGNISQDDFKQLAVGMKQKLQKKVTAISENSSLITSESVTDVSYDEHGHFIRVVETAMMPDVGLIHAVALNFRTDFGMLSFVFSSTDTEYGKYADVFSQIARSIDIPEEGVPATVPQTTIAMPAVTDGSTEDVNAHSDRIDSIAYRIGKWIPMILLGTYWAHKSRNNQANKNTTTPLDDNASKSS